MREMDPKEMSKNESEKRELRQIIEESRMTLLFSSRIETGQSFLSSTGGVEVVIICFNEHGN